MPEVSNTVQSVKIFYPDSDAVPLLEGNQGIGNTLHGVVVVDIGERESDQELSESLKQDSQHKLVLG